MKTKYIVYLLVLFMAGCTKDEHEIKITIVSLRYQVHGDAPETYISYGIPHGQYPMEIRDTVVKGNFSITFQVPVLGSKEETVPIFLRWETRNWSYTGIEVFCNDNLISGSEGTCPYKYDEISENVKIHELLAHATP